ncbi:polymerase I and transcript release factor-like [Poecilia latipinna]|uniref:Caveolae associated protein 1b n=3 Tax=Poecilia TaxID=8080 RepID=A0A096LXX4_POEFO|nr:PREDICTED: polymerase I and transcript release factor-like [Poecilia formosa]XP_014872925.1 PREDICTED: polymerase I and transcript release factor-like [Poecilia latipinna]
MATMEALESSSAMLEPQTLTEVSDDELNLPASDEEDNALAAAKKDLHVMGTEEETNEDKDEVQASDTQVNGVMVLSLLDKIIGAVDQIQQTQSGLETRQQEMERTVTSIQGELTKLSKNHSTTSNSVNKMMEKVRKVSINVKTVRATLEKQGGQIKKLENNEAELLKRRNFKVMVYQDDVKVPSKLSISKSLKVSESVSGSRGGSLLELKEAVEEPGEAAEGDKEDKPHVDLSSDEEGVEIEDTIEETRAERIKRTSLQRVQNLKTVFSKNKMDKTRAKTKENLEKTRQKTKENIEKTKQKTKENLEKTRQRTKENIEKTKQKTKENLEKTRHNIEKKMGKLGTRMSVNPERKQKIKTSGDKMKKAFTPDHVVYARSKTAVYKVPPFTFHVKKIREGEVEVVQGTEMVEVSREVEPIGGEDVEVDNAEVDVEMEMVNGGGDEEEHDEDEEEESHDALHEEDDDDDKDSD